MSEEFPTLSLNVLLVDLGCWVAESFGGTRVICVVNVIVTGVIEVSKMFDSLELVVVTVVTGGVGSCTFSLVLC